MSTYGTLGFRTLAATADTTGMNTGNYTAVLTGSVININEPYFECYHIYLTSPAAPGTSYTTCQVYLNSGYWDYTSVANPGNGWDPSQPMILGPGDEVSFLFNVSASVSPAPIVTCWFRYVVAP